MVISVVFTFLLGFYPILSTYDSSADSDIFTRGDSRVFSFESFFCSGYSITSYGSPHLTANLYLLHASSLVEMRAISHIYSNESINANVSAMLNLYLNHESTASINVCLYDPEQYAVLAILTYDDNGFTTGNRYYPILDNCTAYDLNWIPVKENSSGHTGKYLITLQTDIAELVNVHVEILLNRSEYSLESINSTTQHMCSTNSHTKDSCALSSPLKAGRMTGLIVVESAHSSIDWHETISITKACTYHWSTWTALWLPVFVINVVFCSCLYGLLNRAIYKDRMKKFRDSVKKAEVRERTATDTQTAIGSETNPEQEPLLDNSNPPNSINTINYGSTGSASDSGTVSPPPMNSAPILDETRPEDLPITDADINSTSCTHTLTVAVDVESSSSGSDSPPDDSEQSPGSLQEIQLARSY